MTAGKPDRKNNATSTVFKTRDGENDAIRVGYIDKRRGYISGLSVYEANKYAENNPGTQFIFATRDKVRYLNINEVNNLRNKNDALPINKNGFSLKNGDEFNPCDTIKGLNPVDVNDPFTDAYEGCKPEVIIEGGGGVGAYGSPIIGLDGSVMHVRVVNGGFGYKIPPQVRIVDSCHAGSGARAFSVLGSTGKIVETYDDVDDVEEYDFDSDPLSIDLTGVPWGNTYSLTEQIIVGEWDPSKIISLERDTGYEQELNRYLDFLKTFDPNKPWWTTRDNSPVNVVGSKSNTLYPVQHWAWGGSRIEDELFVAVEFEVYGQGTNKNRNLYFQFTSRDGNHSFRVKGVTHDERSGKSRRVVHQVLANTTYDVEVRKRNGTRAKEKFKRLDEIVLEQGLLEEAGRKAKESKKFQLSGERSRIIFADVVGSANDNDDIQVISDIGKFKAHDRTRVELAEETTERIEDRVGNLESKVKKLTRKIDNISGKTNLTKTQISLLEELRGEKTFFEKKIERIQDKTKRRGTYELTYRVNRRSDKTFTTEVGETFMNKYAVGPQQASNSPGTDRGGIPYTMIWKQNFPHPGEYKFRGICDHKADVYFDGEHLMQLPGMRGLRRNREKPSEFVSVDVKKSGPHQIKIELINEVEKRIEQKTLTTNATTKKTVEVPFVVSAQGSGRHRKIQFHFTNQEDPNDTFVIKNLRKSGNTKDITRKVVANAVYTVQAIAGARSGDDPEDGTKVAIEYKGLNDRNLTKRDTIKPARISESNKKIVLFDDKGKDTDANFKIISTSPGVSAKFSDDGMFLLTKFTNKKRGSVTLRLKWNDDKEDGKSVKKIFVLGRMFKLSGDKGSVEHTIDIEKDGLSNFDTLIEQGIIDLGTKKKEGGVSSSNKIFADYLGSRNDNDDMQIQVKKGGVFTARRRRKARGRKGGRSTYDLEFVFSGAEKLSGSALREEISRSGVSNEDTEIQRQTVFNTKDFINKANRKLYRTNHNMGGKLGQFFKTNAVTPFNPLELDTDFPDIKKSVTSTPRTKPQVKFITRDGVPKLKVIGSGKLKIGFKLKVNDNLRTSGVFARQVDIQTDTGIIQLKRDITERITTGRGGGRTVIEGREREELFGSGEFTAGQEYNIRMIQGSSGSGFETTDKTVIFDDDIDDGIDENGLLNVQYINELNPQPEPTKLPIAETTDYAGTHNIVWSNINFPITGNYMIEIEVDDEVELKIGNAKKGRGYVTINKEGFTGNGRSTGKTVYTQEIEKGTYDIRAALVQKPGKAVNDGNPMGLAMSIKVLYAEIEEEILIRKSWNENPFGAALTINAPLPPVPQEPIPPHEGPCPPSPFWHTRYQNLASEQDWYPVNHRNQNGSSTWSRFVNRYAVSPILPLDTKGSGASGGVFTTKWEVEIPYQGYYTLKGAADDGASVRFTQNDSYLPVNFVLDGFRTEKKDLTPHKVFLTKGLAGIEVSLRQSEDIVTKNILTKVFHTADWVAKPTDKGVRKVPIDFDVYGAATNSNREIKFLFKEVGGSHKFIINNVKRNKTTENVTHKVKLGVDYEVTALMTGKTSTTKSVKVEMPVTYNLDNPESFGFKLKNNGRIIEFDDNANDGFDDNSELKIESTDPGVTARFSNDSKKLIVEGPDGSSVSIRFKWNDRSTSGRVFKTIEVGGALFKQSGNSGQTTKTIKIGSSTNVVTLDTRKLEQGVLQKGFGRPRDVRETGSARSSNIVFADYIESANDNNDMQIRCKEGEFTPSDRSRINKDRGRGTWKLKYRLDKTVQTVDEINEVDGATYRSKRNAVDSSGRIIQPKLATYKRGKLGRRLSPFFKEGKDARREIQGKTWEMTWENVDFPITGEYTFKAEADDRVFIDIDDERIGIVRGGSVNEFRARIPSGKKKVKLTLFNLKIPRTTFRENPTYTAVKITCLVPEQVEDDRSWRVNPTGVAAVLIPPPCERAVGGIGTVPKIIITDPGGGYPLPTPELTPIIDIPGETITPPPPVIIPGGGDTPSIPPDGPTGTPLPPGLPPTGGDGGPTIGEGTSGDGSSTGGGITGIGIGTEGSEPRTLEGQLILIGIHTISAGIGYTPGDTVRITPVIQDDGGIFGDDQLGLPPPIIELPLIAGPFGQVETILVPRPPSPPDVGDPDLDLPPPPDVPIRGDGNINTTNVPIIPTLDIGIPPTRNTPPILPPFTSTPIVDIESPTGVGFKGIPIYELIVDPIDPEPGTIIQITDLVGLKQTGYVRGRAYYGEVYYENGIRFAGRYKTAGTQIQVYDTLLESIEGQVTTRPSAIQRSGTDVTNNDPRLDIPGTPENLS